MTSVAVVFVNFHSEHLIAPRARALSRGGLEVVVSDNSHTFPPDDVTRVVQTGGNVGFGAACNRAVTSLSRSVTEVVFHNPDVDTSPESLSLLVKALKKQQSPGIVAPALQVGAVYRPRGFRYPSAPRELALTASAALSAGRKPPSVPKGRFRGIARNDRGSRFGSAALLVVSRDAFVAVGGFDERFFLYGEDLDLWHRISVSGFDATFHPAVTALHQSGTGSPMGVARRELLRWVGVELFLYVHGARWRAMRLVHRTALPLFRSHDPEMVAVLSRLLQGASPVDVALRTGRLVGRGSSAT